MVYFTDSTWYNSRVDLFVVDSAVIVYDTDNDEESLKIWIVLLAQCCRYIRESFYNGPKQVNNHIKGTVHIILN